MAWFLDAHVLAHTSGVRVSPLPTGRAFVRLSPLSPNQGLGKLSLSGTDFPVTKTNVPKYSPPRLIVNPWLKVK